MVLRASSLAEMIVALGIAGSAIFSMLYLAAKTAKQARANQERYVSSEAAADAIAIAVAARGELREYVCASGNAQVGVLASPGNSNGYEILPEEQLEDITIGERTYKLLPQRQNAGSGIWEECSNCTEDAVYLYRGLLIERNEADNYWNVKSIVWWSVFGTPENTVIETRLLDGCE